MMLHRLRPLAPSFALIFSLGVVCVGASAATSARISAHLTSTLFTPAHAGTVKLVYKFSSKSSRFAYVLSRRTGGVWSTVRSVSKQGSFRGSHTTAIGALFESKPVRVGKYRLKLSSSANSVTLSFTVAPAGKPHAGRWSGSVSGPVSSTLATSSVTVTRIEFTVEPDHATVSHFTFFYRFSAMAVPPNPSCGFGAADYVSDNNGTPSPVTNGHFSAPSVTGPWEPGGLVTSGGRTYEGTFDSATVAHGTAKLSLSFDGISCTGPPVSTGTFSWSATGPGFTP